MGVFENRGIPLTDIPQFWVGNIQSHDTFKPIVPEQKYFIDYNT